METENVEQKKQAGEVKAMDQKNELLNHDSSRKNKNYVYPIRDWKEYLGESFLIIFSVLLALLLTEYISKLHEKENTRTLLKNIVLELKHNKKVIQEMHGYNLEVLDKIDSVLIYKKLQNELISNDEFHLNVIAPDGILYRSFDKEAWTVAINNNIMSKIDIESITLLTRLYEQQDEIVKVEDEAARIIFNRTSRDPKLVHQTLILIRDIYHGWAVDRIPGLLNRIDAAINKLESEELNR